MTVTTAVAVQSFDDLFRAFPRGTRWWSYTKFEDYACPLHYKFKRLDKVPEVVSPALHKGRLAHEIIGAYNRHLLETGQETDVSAIDGIAYEAFFNPSEPHSLPPDAYAEVQQLARQFASYWILDLAHTVSVEEIWGVPVPGTDRDVMIVILDHLAIDGDLARIRDFKTDWHLRSLSDVEEDLQLRVYAWAVKQMYPQVERFEATLDFVRHQKDRTIELDLADVALAEEAIIGTIQRIQAETEWKPAPGAPCTWCAYADRCPAVGQHADVVRIASPEDAERVAGELAVLERQVELRKAALKDWTNVAGPVAVNGLEWGHFLSQSEGIDDVEAFIERCRKIGINPMDFLTVSTQRLQKLPAKDRERLADLMVDKSRTSFRSRKVKAGANGAA